LKIVAIISLELDAMTINYTTNPHIFISLLLEICREEFFVAI